MFVIPRSFKKRIQEKYFCDEGSQVLIQALPIYAGALLYM